MNQRALRTRKEPSYVYVATDDRGSVKVGSSRAPKRRISSLQAASPTTVRLHSIVCCKAAQQVERDAHEVLKPCRIKREWFKCEPGAAEAVIRCITREDDTEELMALLVEAFIIPVDEKALDRDFELSRAHTAKLIDIINRIEELEPGLVERINPWAVPFNGFAPSKVGAEHARPVSTAGED